MATIYNNNGKYVEGILYVQEGAISDESVLGKIYPIQVYYENYLVAQFDGGIQLNEASAKEYGAPFIVFNNASQEDPIRALGPEVKVSQVEIRSGTMYIFIIDYVLEEENNKDKEKAPEYFHFGLKNLTLLNEEPFYNTCYVTRSIKVEGSYAGVHIDASTPAGTGMEVSFFIGEREHPVLPMNHDYVMQERIFPGIPLRFLIDTSKPYAIYNNGEQITITLDEAMRDFMKTYSISYYPLDINRAKHVPLNDYSDIRVKYVLRDYVGDSQSVKITSSTIMTKEEM